MCLGVRRTWETVPKVQRGATTWWTQSSQIGQVSYHGRPSPSLPRPRVDRFLHCSYIVCMTELRFEWDPKKALSNKRQHGVAFEDAATVAQRALGSCST